MTTPQLPRWGLLASLSLSLLLGACGGGEDDVWPPAPQVSPATACAGPLQGSHATYHVGPGQALAELTDVPWLSLQAGDVVNIHHRAEPYRTKFGLRAQGTAQAPVIINGVTDASCNRPVISGDQAVTAKDAKALGFSTALESAGLIQIFRLPTDPWDTYTPRHITIQNLKLTGARRDASFKAQDGRSLPYGDFSAAVYAVRVHHLTVENCEITGNGLGVFTNSKGEVADGYSAHVIIRRNRIYDNGNPGRSTEHNLYVQARRALYEGNFIGQSFGGSSLKDRSSGTVIRYNHILASARALDLVETEEEGVSNVGADPLYPYAWVYGNTIINDSTAPGGFAVNMVHWGFDNDLNKARGGTLFFYNNTVVNRVPQSAFWYVVPFQIGADGQAKQGTTVESASNIFWQQSSTEWRFLSSVGTLQFRGSNYLPGNWNPTSPVATADVRTEGATLLTGFDPALDASFVPKANAPVLNQPVVGPSFTPPGAFAANLSVRHQYRDGVGIVATPAPSASGVAIGALQRP